MEEMVDPIHEKLLNNNTIEGKLQKFNNNLLF